ncbi:caspase domain-containing protein [Phthorimaea operculella]|nr:caspase domain-containing protein [Phthorimaea operculella]
MLKSDSRSFKVDSVLDNINSITVDAVAKIEKELDPYDLVSLVFLLYDVPDTALQRLIVFQRVASDGDTSLNLLYDWAQHVQSRPTWKYEFLEALAVCQLYSIIRKLGFRVTTVQKHYLPDNVHTSLFVNPMKKALYKLCENITSDNLDKLQNTLKTYDIDTTEYVYCELVFIELMCKKFITVDNFNIDRSNGKYNVEKIVKILHSLPGLHKFADELKDIQGRLNNESGSSQTKSPNTSAAKDDAGNDSEFEDCDDDGRLTANDFNDLWKHFNELNLDEHIQNLKSDTKKKLDDSAYVIKNPKRIGVCYIINQEDFHPSKESIESGTQSRPLERRLGSGRDRMILDQTMSALNFEVITHKNIDHRKMLDYIKQIIQYRVHPDDSMFMLCILSHGVRGHVFAADSVKVKVDLIQNLLDDGLQQRQLDIPKLMILQACQVNIDDEPKLMLSADSPSDRYLKKLNFLIYWATAPELEAFRDQRKGSIFIQRLCYIIQKCAKQEHLNDIFTRVNDDVAKICTYLNVEQVPIFESTLRKKLYLQVPE